MIDYTFRDCCFHSDPIDPRSPPHPNPEEFIGNIPVHASRYNAEAERVAEEFLRDWNWAVNADGLCEGFKYEHIGGATPLGNFATWCYPEMTPERVALCTIVCDFGFYWDDITDCISVEKMTEVTNDLAVVLMAEVKLGQRLEPKLEVSKLMVKVVREMLDMDREGGLMMIDGWKSHLDGQSKSTHNDMSFEQYRIHRLKELAAEWAVGLGCWASNVHITPEEKKSVDDFIVAGLIGAEFMNDYYSFDKEFAEHQRTDSLYRMQNGVALLMREYGYPEHEAREIVRQQLWNAEKAIMEGYHEWEKREGSGPRALEIRRYIAIVVFIISGATYWHSHSPRYHRADISSTPEERATLVGKCHRELRILEGYPPPNGFADLTKPLTILGDASTTLNGEVSTADNGHNSDTPNGVTNGDSNKTEEDQPNGITGHQNVKINGEGLANGGSTINGAALTNGTTTTNGQAQTNGEAQTNGIGKVNGIKVNGEANTNGNGVNHGGHGSLSTYSGDFRKAPAHVCEAPYVYINSLQGKNMRNRFIDMLNSWLPVQQESLQTIKNVIQMLHNSSLMLDDIEDTSILRRGHPATHCLYGTSQTINSANFAYVKVVQETLKLQNRESINALTDELNNLHCGQSLDLYWRFHHQCPSIDDYIMMVDNKTGGLFRMILRLMEAESPAPSTASLTSLLTLTGRYYQIRDDYLSLTSAEYTTKKGFCEDFDEGKFSLPLIYVLQNTPYPERITAAIFHRPAGERTVSQEVKTMILNEMDAVGTFDYVRRVLKHLHTELMTLLDEVEAAHGTNPAARLLMLGLAL
ncbi:isoprenoid synthase domain-containing protein [Aspergillus karnatakaensis]|uniref:bifunctional terpene synthase/polyprenyl synthetase family protein n=1 Tax=Aspergillus karnatakaensis TaxID=1810916 RepID=UPI003CCDD53A